MKCTKVLIFIIVSCLAFTNAAAAVVVNKYSVENTKTIHTIVDSTLYNAISYVGKNTNNEFIIDQILNKNSYRLNKKIITLIDFTNTHDSIINLKFYASRFRFTNTGEFLINTNNSIALKPSAQISANKQFLIVSISPKTTLQVYLIQEPISFKDYYSKKNLVYSYTNKFSLPEFDRNISKETIGFCILILLLLGMVFVLFIFYGLAYLNLKDKIYLSYTFYLGFTFLQVLHMSQYTFAKCFLLFNYIGNSCFDESTKGLMVVAYCIFYRQAFNINRKNKIAYITINLLMLISIFYVLILIMSHVFKIENYFEPTYFIYYRVPLFFLSLIFILASISIKNKSNFQKLILFGSLLYTLFAIFSFMQDINFPFKNMLVSVHGLYLGVAVELFVFSVALAMRIRDTYQESEILKDKYIVELQKNEALIQNENILLEEKVKERVEEINLQNVFIEEQKRSALIQSFEKEKVEIQLLALSSQMNPHFIFNCMNSIQHSIVTNDTEKASTMLHNFASLIRMVLENSSQPDIKLDNEILLLNTYLKLEQERTNNTFEYEIAVDKNISSDFIKIPIMMLQPFLENAIWHGFKFIDYKGKIDIQFSMIDEKICCTITDNGIGREKAKQLETNLSEKKSLAIQIIQNRIHLINQTLNDNKASMQIIDLKDKEQNAAGTKVIVELPIL